MNTNDCGTLFVIPAVSRLKVCREKLKPQSIIICHSGSLLAGIQKDEMSRQPAVYILASKRNGTLYIGVTADLVKRVLGHRNNIIKLDSG